MTREEAIRILYVYSAVYLVDASHRKAFDMAIKALEQEPCEDTISRQAAIDAAQRWPGGHRLKNTAHRSAFVGAPAD